MVIKNPPLDLLDLTLVLRAAEAGSLTAAGRPLGLAPAAASRRLAALERRLGTRLFARTTRRLRPTPEGEAFIGHVERALASVADAEAAVALAATGADASLSGVLRLTAPATFGRKVLAPLLARFLTEHPALRLDLVLADAVLDLVEDGRDAAIRIAPLVGDTLVARKLAPNARVLCASPGYLAKRGTPETPDSLANHDALLLAGTDAWHLSPADGGPTRRVRPKPRIASNSNEALREACLAGLGIGLHSTWDIGEHLRAGDLVALSPTLGLPAPLAIWFVYPGPAPLAPPRVRRFADWIAEHLRSGP